MDHYLNVHIPLVCKLWGPFGFKAWKVLHFREEDPSGLYLQAMTFWDDVEGFEKARATTGKEVADDGEFH